MSCNNDPNAPVIPKDHVYWPSWGLRYRNDDTKPHNVHHSYSQPFQFNSTFYSLASTAMFTVYYYAAAAGHGNIQWIGTSGAQNKASTRCHSSGRALDITAIEFQHTSFDMKTSWKADELLAQQRGYLAIWAGLRIYCKSVLSNAYDAKHEDHFHIDNGENGLAAPPAIRTSVRTDTTLVQTACNVLNGANLTIDGHWGASTTQAYNSLMNALGMTCLSPLTYFWHTRTFLIQLMRHGFASKPAGTFRYPFCR